MIAQMINISIILPTRWKVEITWKPGAMRDYATDRRGDVGSWVREVAMEASEGQQFERLLELFLRLLWFSYDLVMIATSFLLVMGVDLPILCFTFAVFAALVPHWLLAHDQIACLAFFPQGLDEVTMALQPGVSGIAAAAAIWRLSSFGQCILAPILLISLGRNGEWRWQKYMEIYCRSWELKMSKWIWGNTKRMGND